MKRATLDDVELNGLVDELQTELGPMLNAICTADELAVELHPGIVREGRGCDRNFRTATDAECCQMQIYLTFHGELNAAENVPHQIRRFLARALRQIETTYKLSKQVHDDRDLDALRDRIEGKAVTTN